MAFCFLCSFDSKKLLIFRFYKKNLNFVKYFTKILYIFLLLCYYIPVTDESQVHIRRLSPKLKKLAVGKDLACKVFFDTFFI